MGGSRSDVDCVVGSVLTSMFKLSGVLERPDELEVGMAEDGMIVLSGSLVASA